MTLTPKSSENRKSARKPSELRQFSDGLRKSAALARHPLGRFLVGPVMRWFARKTLRIRQARPEAGGGGVRALAEEYQRLFPNKRMYEITEVTDDTAYFEIHVQCPLRGTGDAKACHRLMQYDRSLAAHIGANFRVLESQSVTGAETCRVALRRKGLSTDDLIEPHERG